MEKEKKLGRIIKNHTNLRKNKPQIQGKKWRTMFIYNNVNKGK